MHTDRGKYEIAKEVLARKKELFLHPPVGFVGCRGFEKFIQELPRWKTELSREDYDRQLYQMVSFWAPSPRSPTPCGGSTSRTASRSAAASIRPRRCWRALEKSIMTRP